MILYIVVLSLGVSQRLSFFLQILRLCTSEMCGLTSESVQITEIGLIKLLLL